MIPKNEYAPYFEQYIQLATSKNMSIVDSLRDSQVQFNNFMQIVPKEKQNFSYAKGKWTLKEVIQHIIDTERIFCFRALTFARNDKISLPGFDQDEYVNNDNLNNRDYYDLLDELKIVRKSTIHLMESFSEEALLRVGVASSNSISVRAIGYLFSGHQLHHLSVIKERYL